MAYVIDPREAEQMVIDAVDDILDPEKYDQSLSLTDRIADALEEYTSTIEKALTVIARYDPYGSLVWTGYDAPPMTQFEDDIREEIAKRTTIPDETFKMHFTRRDIIDALNVADCDTTKEHVDAIAGDVMSRFYERFYDMVKEVDEDIRWAQARN